MWYSEVLQAKVVLMYWNTPQTHQLYLPM